MCAWTRTLQEGHRLSREEALELDWSLRNVTKL
jgi:hypothetical protein